MATRHPLRVQLRRKMREMGYEVFAAKIWHAEHKKKAGRHMIEVAVASRNGIDIHITPRNIEQACIALLVVMK